MQGIADLDYLLEKKKPLPPATGFPVPAPPSSASSSMAELKRNVMPIAAGIAAPLDYARDGLDKIGDVPLNVLQSAGRGVVHGLKQMQGAGEGIDSMARSALPAETQRALAASGQEADRNLSERGAPPLINVAPAPRTQAPVAAAVATAPNATLSAQQAQAAAAAAQQNAAQAKAAGIADPIQAPGQKNGYRIIPQDGKVPVLTNSPLSNADVIDGKYTRDGEAMQGKPLTDKSGEQIPSSIPSIDQIAFGNNQPMQAGNGIDGMLAKTNQADGYREQIRQMTGEARTPGSIGEMAQDKHLANQKRAGQRIDLAQQKVNQDAVVSAAQADHLSAQAQESRAKADPANIAAASKAKEKEGSDKQVESFADAYGSIYSENYKAALAQMKEDGSAPTPDEAHAIATKIAGQGMKERYGAAAKYFLGDDGTPTKNFARVATALNAYRSAQASIAARWPDFENPERIAAEQAATTAYQKIRDENKTPK